MIDKKHIGSSFDTFLEEENILQEAEAVAIKRVFCSRDNIEKESEHED